VLSTDYNAMVRLRQRLDVEPLIYTLLVSAGKVIRSRSAATRTRHVLDGLSRAGCLRRENITDLEVAPAPRLLDEIRRHYRLARALPIPIRRQLCIPAANQAGLLKNEEAVVQYRLKLGSFFRRSKGEGSCGAVNR